MQTFDGASLTARLLVGPDWSPCSFIREILLQCMVEIQGAICAFACSLLQEENSLTVFFLQDYAFLSCKRNKPTILPDQTFLGYLDRVFCPAFRTSRGPASESFEAPF
jgi:hypothetical protein